MRKLAGYQGILYPAIALLLFAAGCGDDSVTGAGGAGGGTGGANPGGGGPGGPGSGGGGPGGSGMGGSGMGGSGMGGSGMGGSGTGGSGTGGSGTGGSGTGGSGMGGSGGESGECVPGTVEPCYSGPANTENVGICAAGRRTCAADGSGFGACVGEVTPAAEDCATPVDDDCDGEVNEVEAGCVCAPGETESCYTGPDGTEGIGICSAGTMTCAADGRSYGPCVDEVLPGPETCTTVLDDDCDGATNEEGEGCACSPGATQPCYSGPPGTQGVGRCAAGVQQCNAEGTAFGACIGEVLPEAEACATPQDDDCDGQVNEPGDGCVCAPGSTASCYTGPDGTAGVGACAAGTMTCNGEGTGYGPCTGEVTPTAESCTTAQDDNCDGQSNEGCVSYARDVQPILVAKCASCHTVGSSGTLNVTNYATTQAPSYSCAGSTKGACSLTRIQNGTMPAGRGCTGNPTLDAGRPACLTAAEQSTLAAWIAGGQLP